MTDAPNLQSGAPIAEPQTGHPSRMFQRWWQALRNSVIGSETQIAAQAALIAAQAILIEDLQTLTEAHTAELADHEARIEALEAVVFP